MQATDARLAEELRETVVAMGRELDLLRTETRHAQMLLGALDQMLVADRDHDPFAGVFSAVLSIFDYSHALALVADRAAPEGDIADLECVSSSHEALVGSRWPVDRPLDKALAGRVMASLEPADGARWPAQARGLLTPDQPALYLPLRVRDQRGLLMLLREAGSPGFDRSHVRLAHKFTTLASHAFAASRAHQTEAESHRLRRLTEDLEASQEVLAHRANHDQLTGLSNRAHIQELVNARIAGLRPGEQLAIAFVDLDHFKRVNDFYGHAVGDALLKGMAARMLGEIRSSDLIGRISGDEFVVALAPITGQPEIMGLVERIRARLREPLTVDDWTLRTSATIGIAICPDHGVDYETLRSNADTAMYQAKTQSPTKGGIAFFSRSLGQRAAERHTLERRLRSALDNHQFTYVLQPQLDLHHGRVIGFEALVRWIDEQGTIRPPAAFLSAAGEFGLLDPITFGLLDRLAADMLRLDAHFGAAPRYHINIGAEQVARSGFIDTLVERALRLGCAHRLTVEFSERVFLGGDFLRSCVLPPLRAAGIHVAIDDFGLGDCGIGSLAEGTADLLKIARPLVQGVHRDAALQRVVRAAVSMAQALELPLVAGGIESEADLLHLRDSAGLRFGYGHLLAPPGPVHELIAEQREALQRSV